MTHADTIITNADIHTIDRDQPRASSMAITGGRITAITNATNGEQVANHAGPDTDVIDLHGQFVMPGISDVHNHHAAAGRADLYELSFSPAATIPDILDAVRKYAANLGPNEWIFGGSWGSPLMDELATHRARRALDEAAGGRPVLLTDDSYHNRWVSTRTLELAGITASSTAPAGGQMLLEDGEPTGIMLEAAGRLMELSVPDSDRPDAAGWRRCSQRGVEMLGSHGITAFQDAAVSTNILQALHSLDTAGELNAWVVSSMLFNDPIFGYSPIGEELLAAGGQYRSEHHRPDFIKIFLDGVPPARTGAFIDPYLPDAAHGDDFRGETTMTADELTDSLRIAARAGLSAKIHCTGDRSVRMVLDAVSTLRAEGHTTPRYQIAHGQFVSDADIPRFAQLGVDADISPFLWMPGVIPTAIAGVLPADRAGKLQPNRGLLDAGALVAGGSDWPVSESPNAFPAIAALINRADPTGTFPGALWPEQAVTRDEAIEIFTLAGATSMGLGAETGSLTVGKSADFVVLDRNITSCDTAAIAGTTVTNTYFAGREVYTP